MHIQRCALKEFLCAEVTHVIALTLLPQCEQTFPFPRHDTSRGGPGHC